MDIYPALVDLRDDFDLLAAYDHEKWNHSSAYHGYLLKHLPHHCRTVLEIGCGSGTFARLLAQHSEKVIALDLSPRMIDLAQERSQGYSNIDYRVADGITFPQPLGSCDCIVSISTLHHLDLALALSRFVELLRPGGVLLVLDLYRAVTISDHLFSVLAFPVNLVMRVWHGDVKRKSAVIRRAWAAHQVHERLVTLAVARHICTSLLPGAQLRRHLLWRYSIVWVKPGV